jgi:predicted porin
MDKKLKALLLAGLMALPYAASADVAVYGRIRMGLVNTDVTGSDDYWELLDSTSRLGFDASTTTNGGTEVFMKYEFSVDAANTAALGGRHSHIGLKTNFGTLTFGRQWTTFYDFIGGPLDMYNQIGNIAYFQQTTSSRQGESIEWVHSAGALSFGATAIVDGDSGVNGESFVDATQLAAKWDGGALKLAAAIVNNDISKNAGTTVDLTALYGEFSFGMAKLLGAFYDSETDTSGTKTDRKDHDVQVVLKFTDTVEGRFGVSEVENVRDGTNAAVQFDLGGGVKTYAEFESLDFEPGQGTDTDRMAFGIRYDFK